MDSLRQKQAEIKQLKTKINAEINDCHAIMDIALAQGKDDQVDIQNKKIKELQGKVEKAEKELVELGRQVAQQLPPRQS